MSYYKSYPAYKDSGVEWLGRVPEHWQTKRLKHIAKVQTGVAKGKDNEGKDTIEVPYLRVANVQDGYLSLDNVATIAIPREDLTRYSLRPGDVLMNEGGDFDKLGRGSVWLGEIDPCIHQNHVFAVRPTVVSSAWLNAFTGSLAAQFYFMGRAKQSTNLASISSSNIMELPVTMPPVAEVELLLAHLNRETVRIDALIEKKTRFIELLREKRQALIISAVTKGLDHNVRMKDSGVEWLGEVPEHWSVLQLRHTARLESGHTPSRSKPEYWVGCNVPWFTLADVWQVRSGEQKYVSETSEKVSQLGLENSSARLLPAGSVFLSRTASVGFPGIMAVDMATSQDFAVWTCTSELFNEYLYYILLGMKPDFDRLMMGSTHKTIYMPDIEAIRIARPPLDEQRGIVSALGGQLGRFKIVIDKTERSIELLKERRSALITAAVTGQIDLRATE